MEGLDLWFAMKLIKNSQFQKSTFLVVLKYKSLSNFAMGTILEKSFPQAQVHTVYSMSAETQFDCSTAKGKSFAGLYPC